MENTGLLLGRVSLACMKVWGRPLQNATLTQSASAACNQTWYWCPSQFGMEGVCRRKDEPSEQLAPAHWHERKPRAYTPILEAPQTYLEGGCQVKSMVTVGIRGLLDSGPIKRCLEFLSVPRRRWERIIEDVAKESVKAFFSLHRVSRCYIALQLCPLSSGVRTTQNVAGTASAGQGQLMP
jgi:hypothetical protein